MRKYFKLLGLVGVVLGLAFAPNANAVADEDVPTASLQAEGAPDPGDNILALCAVSGQVFADGTPPPLWTAHGHYNFLSSILECVGTPGNPSDTLNVLADGATDGTNVSPWDEGDDSAARRAQCGVDPASCVTTPGVEHGSSEPISWSHSGDFRNEGGCGGSNDNRGNISADGALLDGAGWVKFIRVGPAVVAWGAFCSGSLAGQAFNAELVFTPTAVDGVFDLNGASVIWDD